MDLTVNGGNNTITIDFSGITTYGELKKRLPSTGEGRIPGVNQLRKKAAVVLCKETDSGIIEIFDNGFFIFEKDGHTTVYGVDRCEYPETYNCSGKKDVGTGKQDFSEYPWELILESAGSARLDHNQESREEHQTKISIDVLKFENNIALSVWPEYEIRDKEEEMAAWQAKRIARMKLAMKKPTDRQRKIAMMYFRENKTQKEIAIEIGRSQAYVSRTLKRYIEIVNENF